MRYAQCGGDSEKHYHVLMGNNPDIIIDSLLIEDKEQAESAFITEVELVHNLTGHIVGRFEKQKVTFDEGTTVEMIECYKDCKPHKKK